MPDWNPVGSDSARRYDAGLTVRRGTLGLGATVCLSSESARTITTWAADMAQTLDKLGYVYECTDPEPESDGHTHTVWFRRVKKAAVL